MKLRVIFLILMSALTITGINAQKNNKKIIITGTVLGADKAPVANAFVMIDDQKTNTVTDANGNYKVKVKPTATKISIVTFGLGTKEEAINGRDHIDFNFGVSAAQQQSDKEVAPSEQGVNAGYGMVKKKNVTTQANNIDGTKSKYASYHSISEMIQREFAGVKVDGSSVVIQGSADLFGSVPALIIVDGVSSYELPDISPIYVKSVDVLKGTAASIYGTRGYGGVVIIKTKIQNE